MKLKNEHCFRAVPYYAERIAESNNDISNLGAVGKEILTQEGAERFKNPMIEETVRYAESSGTTGQKSFGWYCDEDMKRLAYQFADVIKKEDIVMIRFPYALSYPPFMIECACKNFGATIVPVSGRTEVSPYFKVVDMMHELNVTVLACNPREAEILYEAIAVQGLSVEKFLPKLRNIILAGEIIGSARRAYIERIWGATVFDVYGSTELGCLGYTCKCGRNHFDESNFYAEIFNDGKFMPVINNERNPIFVTTMNNTAAPHFRFETKDIVEFSDEKCQCGSSDRVITVCGRQSDLFSINDRTYTFYDIQEVIYSLPAVPFGWKISHNDEKILQLEFNNRDRVERQLIEKSIYDKLKCDSTQLKVEIFSDFGLFDRSAIYRIHKSRKPQYIFHQKQERVNRLVEEGKKLLSEGDLQSAEIKFKAVLRELPESEEGYLWMAATLGLQADKVNFIKKMSIYPQLYSHTNKAVEIDKYSAFGNYLLGILLMKTPEDIGGDKIKAYRHLCLSKYLGYSTEDMDAKITSLEEKLFCE